MCSFSASPAPSPSQKRPGYIASSVAAPWAIMAGWYRKPGGVTPVPKRRLVVAPRAPSQDHTKALWPCSGVQGWKWSEAMTEVKPLSSATLLHLSRSVGWNCSNIAAYPTVPVVSMNASFSRSARQPFGRCKHSCPDHNSLQRRRRRLPLFMRKLTCWLEVILREHPRVVHGEERLQYLQRL